jgi:hypothetical protein
MASAAPAVIAPDKLWIGNPEFAGQVILEVDTAFQNWSSCRVADEN